MEKIISILLWIWQLPQNLLGVILLGFVEAKQIKHTIHIVDDLTYCVIPNMPEGSGVSLGKYIFVQSTPVYFPYLWKHESGHSKQSKILGWLYVFVIGVPSLIWAGIYRLFNLEEHFISYYSFYTEKWANKLAGITIK